MNETIYIFLVAQAFCTQNIIMLLYITQGKDNVYYNHCLLNECLLCLMLELAAVSALNSKWSDVILLIFEKNFVPVLSEVLVQLH